MLEVAESAGDTDAAIGARKTATTAATALLAGVDERSSTTEG